MLEKELETEDSLLFSVFLGDPVLGPNLRAGGRHIWTHSLFN